MLAGRPVSRPGLGAMKLTGPGTWGEPKDPAGARALLRRARELGVQFFDTADSYGPGVSERLLREALHPYGDLVVATKGGHTRQGPSRWARNGRPEHLRAACESSLQQLGVDCIELYQLHAVDPDVPIEESLGALVELRAEGKIRHVGVCNVTTELLVRALDVVELASVQNRFSLADRESQAVLDACAQRDIVFVPWAPIGGGGLARAGGPVGRVAKRAGATPAQVALAWLLHRSTVVLPIPGTRSLAHLEENVASAAVELSDDDLDALGSIVRPRATESMRIALRRRLRSLRRA
jgi:aryl-alcohol dehydrogenase-like predicted oxidoreductase